MIKFSNMIREVYDKCYDGETRYMLTELQLFFDINILEKEKEGLREIKQALYKRMIEEKDPVLNRKLCEMWVDFKKSTKGYEPEKYEP